MEFFCALSIATSKSMILKRFDNGGDGVSRVHLNPRRKATPKEESKQVAFIPFITADDPDLTTTSKALKVLDSYGSDLIKLGVPYSDPFVDGPVIQVVEVLNPLAREVKSIGTMKKELVELQEELANAHTLVYWFMEAVPKNPDALKLLAKEFHSGLNLRSTLSSRN